MNRLSPPIICRSWANFLKIISLPFEVRCMHQPLPKPQLDRNLHALETHLVGFMGIFLNGPISRNRIAH